MKKTTSRQRAPPPQSNLAPSRRDYTTCIAKPSILAHLSLAAATLSAAPVDFQRQIRPILSDNCFQCHGPDANTRQADLRLDRRETAAPVLSGKSAGSLLYQRVSEKDPALRMPPPESHKSLTPPQIDLLRQWIDQGAPWKEHWAFQTPLKPKPPAVRNAAWVRNPIDRFLLARLEAEGLAPAPEADRRTLLRRVALDVTGLPPRPVEIEQFLADTTPGAYERMVDRYLASPHYGEHRARYWLDAARYGDTHGIHIDNYRDIWPYRDWVIAAFNRNLPFDRFTIEQLAGDLLPDATLDQRIATGFMRCGVTTNEAGIIEDEYAEIYAKDRADTVGAVWLGLTVGCATCHDHKFDPISQKDFYSLGAFFRNTTQKVMDGNISDTPPIVLVPRAQDRARWMTVQARLAALRIDLDRVRDSFPPLETPPPFKPDADRPFSVGATFTLPEKDQGYQIASQQNPRDRNRGWLLDIQSRQPGFKLNGPNDSIEVRSAEPLKPGMRYHVAATYDGSRNQSGLALYVNGRIVRLQGLGVRPGKLNGSITVDDPAQPGKSLGDIQDFHTYGRVLMEAESAGRSVPEPFRALAGEQHQLNLEAAAIAARGAVTLVMEERTDRTPFANILYRGAYDQKRERVEAGTPSVLPPMSASLPRNRLGFGQWLFTADHPLTARVAVNRMWQEIFGAGIVRTPDDFGSQGEPPSNLQLLDWLAVDFREHGWDVKRFYRQILTSAAYRQSARTTPAKLAKDPENRLVSRGPRFRMDAEMIRDYALAAAGLLAPQIGGPSVRPYQPPGVWEAVAMEASTTRFYKRDTGDGLYRRSLYTIWKRSAPPASMEIFNAPTRETCTVRRERTDTPLQALVTMNDVQFLEAARVLSATAMQSVLPFDARLDFIALRALSRPLTLEERAIARQSFDTFERYYQGHPSETASLLDNGDRKSDPNLPAAPLAAFTMLTSQLLNLDEVLNK